MMFGLSWPAGFAALFAVIGAAGHYGASPTVTGVIGAAGPPLVVGLIYLVAAGIWVDWIMFWLGAWVLLAAAIGAWTGPVGALLLNAVAVGGGFLAAAALVAWRNRS
jgi:hypothetical protein